MKRNILYDMDYKEVMKHFYRFCEKHFIPMTKSVIKLAIFRSKNINGR